jgi:hypothetical protein
MSGPINPQAPCTAAQIAQIRAEARRDLKAMLVPFTFVGSVIIAVGLWRGPGALWPVWGPTGTTIAVALAVGVWATYIRGWRVLRNHRRRSSAGIKTHGRVRVQTD